MLINRQTTAAIIITIIIAFTAYFFYLQYNQANQVDQNKYPADENMNDREDISLEENDFDSEVASFIEDIASAETDINMLKSNGINVENYNNDLLQIKNIVNQAQEKISGGSLEEGDVLLKEADNRLSKLEDSIGLSLEALDN